MALAVSEFMGLIGLNFEPPQTIAELIPYLLTFFVGVVLIVAVFKLIGGIARALMSWRRF